MVIDFSPTKAPAGIQFLIIFTVLLLGSLGLVQSRSIQLPASALWLTAGSDQVWALLRDGTVYSLQPQPRQVAVGWSPEAPIQFAHGRLHGVSQSGELVTLEGGQAYQSQGAKLSLRGGVLGLPAGAIAIGVGGDLLRLERSGQGWEITARASVNVPPDSRLAFADLEGDSDPEVVAFLSPSGRYPHGVLGDALEPTAVAAFERHSLQTLWRLDLPAPYVFEDIAPRVVQMGGRDVLVTVRSSAWAGAALALVGLTNQKLQLSLGLELGIPNRWMNPLVGFGEVYAIHTPHLGGILHRYTVSGNLGTSRLLDGISSHAIGSRNLEPAIVLAAGRLLVPSQNHREMLRLGCSPNCQIETRLTLEAPYSSNLVLLGGQAVIGDTSGKVYFWRVL